MAKKGVNKQARTNSKLDQLVTSLERLTVGSMQRKSNRQRPKSRKTSGRVVTAPVSSAALIRYKAPSLNGNSMDSVRLASKSLVIEAVKVGIEYQVSVVPLVPCIQHTWLSGVACYWSKYRWRSCRLVYIPYCSSSFTGYVSMGLSYDYADAIPSDETEMSALKGYTTTSAWAGSEGIKMLSYPTGAVPSGAVVLSLDCASMSKPWYPYISAVAATNLGEKQPELLNQYTPARAFIGTGGGMQGVNGLTAGRVFMVYDIELIEPVSPAMQENLSSTGRSKIDQSISPLTGADFEIVRKVSAISQIQ
ncbi:coat protein [Poinsettia latent virus]|uniref:Capsid protein n=1 Tax=Poinsettia latent virus (isolate Euphorbia pulcherrima/Germany/Siepen/2005) TaxID=686943 RepID=CAPSD_PNLV|nr:coat protein [Poinsettia latent virus]Q5NDM8.1 RecName: Full=Capsid protein; Short=CP; AltName: Full=Coat protein [Poinsettia latent virus isolate Germany/Siepen]CAI34772.1 coat protein [Poinsettia latent virus]